MEFKVAEEVALTEVKEFIDYHLDDEIETDQVSKDYKEVVKAVMLGNLDLTDKDSPVLTLRKPIKKEGGATDTDKVTFLTRIKKSQMAALAKGIDINKDAIGFANRMTAYLIQQPAVAMLDLFGKQDMKVIDQLTGLFL